MELSSISIKQFKQQLVSHAVCYHDDLVVSNQVERLEPFRHPCRMCATIVFFCVEGEIDFSINLKRYHIGSDTMVVIFDGDIVQLHQVEVEEAYVVFLSSEYLHDLQIDLRQRTNFFINTRHNAIVRLPHSELESIVPYYPLLKTSIEQVRASTPDIVRALVQAFSYTVISMMQQYGENDADTNAEAMPRSKRLFDKFMALLKLHHTTERSVKFYADRLCLTPNYLSGCIKDYSGKSAAEWVNEYVVLEAKNMLKNSDLSIQEIAYRLNFITQSAFGKYFKLQTGMSPKTYRNGDRGEQQPCSA